MKFEICRISCMKSTGFHHEIHRISLQISWNPADLPNELRSHGSIFIIVSSCPCVPFLPSSLSCYFEWNQGPSQRGWGQLFAINYSTSAHLEKCPHLLKSPAKVVWLLPLKWKSLIKCVYNFSLQNHSLNLTKSKRGRDGGIDC